VAVAYLATQPNRPADHVLVDKGQGLSPTHWQLLRALLREHSDDLFIAEDSHQRIYGTRTATSLDLAGVVAQPFNPV
jgi:superfamily I DNA/RNA helicase